MSPKLSYDHGTSGQPLLGQAIGDNLSRDRRTSRRTRTPSSSRTARAAHIRRLMGAHDSLRKSLLARGVQAGDRVGIWSPNRFEWPVVQYATARLGAILVNVNPSFKAARIGIRPAAIGHVVAAPRK